MKKKIAAVVLVLLIAAGAFLYFPRGNAAADQNAAALAILNSAIDGSRNGGSFLPALDGEVFANGDVVKSNDSGRAVLTFFDGSSLAIDPGSQVKVVTLNRTADGGLQVTIEQTLGRTWASVQKLKTPDSKFEVRTPSSTAAVRGTAFVTIVERRPDGTTQTTYQADDGTLLVSATAGGTTTVGAGTQVTTVENQPAPPGSSPLPPQPRLDLTGSSGLGFTAISPSGASCNPTGQLQQVPGCVGSAGANKVSVRGPGAGHWAVVLTAAQTLGNATLTIEAFTGTTRDANRVLTRSFNLGDLVKTGFVLGTGTTLTLSALDDPILVTTICGAEAAGRVFSSGPLKDRFDAVRAFGQVSKNQPVSVVITDTELTQFAASGASSQSGVTLKDVKVTIDGGGLHLTAVADTGLLTVNAKGDVAAGPVNDKLQFRLRTLSADPLPPAVVDGFRTGIERSLTDAAATFPFSVRQVALRPGCLAVIGTTAP